MDEVEPASTSELVDKRCFRGSLRCHICSRPRWVGAEDDNRELCVFVRCGPMPVGKKIKFSQNIQFSNGNCTICEDNTCTCNLLRVV